MNFKRFSTSDNQWHGIPYYQHKTATDTLTLPAVIYPNASSVTVGIKGNTTQSGTPSPSNPVDVNGTGERTANVFDKYDNYSVGTVTNNYTITGLKPNTQYTCSTNFEKISGIYTASIYFGGGSSTTNGVWANSPNTQISTAEGTLLLSLRFRSNAGAPAIYDDVMAGTIWVMVNEGSTALPYEPYGYKIPISSANTTTPVYLGEVQTTRKIKKLVLTGEESWNVTSGNAPYLLRLSDIVQTSDRDIILYMSTHYLAVSYNASWSQYNACVSWLLSNGVKGLVFRDTNQTTLSDFKAYLAQQYTAGTPVTVWYVLENPETAVVNEPIRKIGDYADTVSGITIPTIAGANALSIGTTLQPSEATVNYKGWHPVQSVHERENGAWD